VPRSTCTVLWDRVFWSPRVRRASLSSWHNAGCGLSNRSRFRLSAGKLDCGCRLDLLVEQSVIVEIQAVDRLAPIHRAQLPSYLKLSGHKVGLLINCDVRVLRDGVRRLVNDFPDSP